jgi:hypothetical protein
VIVSRILLDFDGVEIMDDAIEDRIRNRFSLDFFAGRTVGVASRKKS